jgi:hypothetical protein
LHEQTRTPSRKMVQHNGLRKAGSQSEVRCAVHCTTGARREDDAPRGPAAQAQKVAAAARREGGGSGAARGGPHSDGSCSESFVPFESSKFLNWPTQQPIHVGDVVRLPDGELCWCVAVSPRKTPRARRGLLAGDGRLLSRKRYAALYAAIGTAYGQGNGATTFQLPDLRYRYAAQVHCTGPSEVADKRQKTARRETARIGTSSSISGPGTEKRRTRNTPPPSTRGRKVAGARAHPLPDTDLTRATPPGGRRRAALARKRPHGKAAPGFGGEMPHKRREVWE